MGARSFTDLIVRQKARTLSSVIYAITETFPGEERFRLIHQMRAAAASIAQNIAEGFGRWSPRDQANSYAIAKTSADELKTQLIQARDLGYTADLGASALADEVGAMLYRLRQRVLARIPGK